MLIAEAQLLSGRERKSFLLNPWQLHTLANLTVWSKGHPQASHWAFLNRLLGCPRQAAMGKKPTRWRVGPLDPVWG